MHGHDSGAHSFQELLRRADNNTPTSPLARTVPIRRRRPEPTPLYRTVQSQPDELVRTLMSAQQSGSVPAYVERGFRYYLGCGILAQGFARARCGQCRHDFLYRLLLHKPGGDLQRPAHGETAVYRPDHSLPRLTALISLAC
jgi:hypothetical protein